MSVYQEKSLLARQIAEKRNTLRKTYGGMMSLTDLSRELGFKRPDGALKWIRMVGLEAVMVSPKRRAYETDRVAAEIVKGRLPA